MKNIRIIIEYDGTNYSGWQVQNNSVTVEQKIEEALEEVTQEKIKVIGSSRTDAGVHAKGFTGNFLTSSTIPPDKFSAALNSKLPQDIVILSSEEVEIDFNSRFNSKGKTYSYTILNSEQRPAIGRNYVYHFKRNLDVNAMQEAVQYFIGTHDFAAFKNSGGNTKTTIRTINKLDILMQGEKIIIYVTGDGFLYNMVRIIVGTLLEVGLGRIKPNAVGEIILSKNRRKAGPCVPATGLCLEKVYY